MKTSPSRHTLLAAIAVAAAITGPAYAQSPVISEIMASNINTLADDDGDFTDWIEFYNPGDSPYSLSGHYLTDDERTLVKRHHPDLYVERHGGLFLNIRNGQVDCRSLQTSGFGVAFLPDFNSLTPLKEWEVKW